MRVTTIKLNTLIALSVFITLFLSCVLATEITAVILDFQPLLGTPIIKFSFTTSMLLAVIGVGLIVLSIFYYFNTKQRRISLLSFSTGFVILLCALPLYNPLAFFMWYHAFSYQVSTEDVWTAGFICLSLAVLISLGMMIWLKMKGVSEPTVDTFGTAHWANIKEIKKTNLLDQSSPLSCYVGAWQSPSSNTLHYLRFTGPEHVFAYAPTRSGKGVGLVIPTLLSYMGSMVISDMKGENWQLTAGWRKKVGHTALKFDPTSSDGTSACFNPLLEVRRGINEVRDIQNIVDVISDPQGLGRSDHWSNTANDVMVSIMLHVLYAEKDKSLAGIRCFISNPQLDETALFEHMLRTQHDPNGQYAWLDPHTGQTTQTHPLVAAGAKDMLNKAKDERSGVMSTLRTHMKLYRDPIVAMNTSHSDFSIADLVYNEKPTSLYLVIPPGDINRIIPLMRLVLSQILNRLTETLDARSGIDGSGQRHPLKLLLDEFPQFGKLTFLEKGLAYLAGYGISAYLIAQDITQLYQIFGHYQSIIANCHVRIAYAPNTVETAKHLSALLGTKTVVKEHKHYSGRRFGLLLKQINVSQHETRRELLTPDELMRLPDDVAIVFMAGHAPIYGKKIRYYQDSVFSERASVAEPETTRLRFETDWMHIVKINAKSTEIDNPIEEDELGDRLLADVEESDSLV